MKNSTIPNWLKQRVYLTPDRLALTFQNQKWTFKQLWDNVQQYAGKIQTLSIVKGEQIGVLVKNDPSSVMIIHALQQVGVTTVLLNNRLSVSELSFQIDDANIQHLIFHDSFREKVTSIEQECSVLKTHSISELHSLAFSEITVEDTFTLDDVCSIMYTSGTTGNPKGVQQTYGNHWWSAIGSALNMGLSDYDRWLCAVPLFHISGYSILMRSVIYGIGVSLHEHFDEKQINQELQAGSTTIISVVSSMLQRLLVDLDEGHYHPRFRCMLLGGGPAPKPLLEKCKSRNIPVVQTYGMTETSSQIVTLSPEHSLTKLGSAGKPLFPCEVMIQTSAHSSQSGNREGEILVKGPNVTIGYLNRDEANEKSFSNGWFHTGDIGYLDDEGFLYVLDRRSDLIISGGENIYPAELEGVLLSHPRIREVAVVGVPSTKWGEVPCAFIVEDEDCNDIELSEFCKQRLASYKVPKVFVRIDELPRNASQKVLRRKLKELAGKEFQSI